MGVCNYSLFCGTLIYVHSSIAIILMGKRELVALLNLSSWCLVMVDWPFLAVPWGCLRFVIVVFPDHTHLLFLSPSVKYFTDSFKAVLLLWIFFSFFLSCVCYAFVYVCLYVPCGHLLGKG